MDLTVKEWLALGAFCLCAILAAVSIVALMLAAIHDFINGLGKRK